MFNRNHRNADPFNENTWKGAVPYPQQPGVPLIEQIEPLRGCASNVLLNIEDLETFKAELWNVLIYWGHGYHRCLWETENGCELYISNVFPRGKLVFMLENGSVSFDLPQRGDG